MRPATKNAFGIGLLALTLVGLDPRVGAQTAKPRLAVTTLENPATGSTIGNGLTEILVSALQKTGRFQLVDRSAAEQVDKTKVNFIVKGKVTNFSFAEQAFQENVATSRGVVLQTQYRQNAMVRVDFQVLRASTGEIVIAEPASDTETRVSATAEEATYRRVLQVGSFSAESQDSLIGRATTKAIENLVRKISDLSGRLSEEIAGNRAAELAAVAGRITAVVGRRLW